MSVSTTAFLALFSPLLVDPSLTWMYRLIGLAIFSITYLIVVIVIRLRQGWRPHFSLRSMLLVVGLSLSLCILRGDGAAWQPIHQFPGFCPTAIFSPDARLVAAVVNSDYPPIEIRETRTGRPLKTIVQPGFKSYTDIAFSKGGHKLLTLGSGRGGCRALLVDWKTGEELRTWPASRPGRVSARGDRFFMYTDDKSPAGPAMCVFQVDRDEPLIEVPKPTSSQQSFEDVISCTGRYMLVLDQGDLVQLWDIDVKQQIGAFTDRRFSDSMFSIFRPFTFSMFSPNDRYLALATRTGVDIWDVERFERIGRWEPDDYSWIERIRWSPTADRFVVEFGVRIGPRKGRTHSALVDREGREIAKVDGSGAAFSPSGDRIAVAFGPVRILDAQTGTVLTSLGSPPQGGSPAAFRNGRPISFSPDGQWLLHNGGATVWHRRRSERWYGIFSIPAFWGADLFLIFLLLPLSRKIRNPATLFPGEISAVKSPERKSPA